MKPKPTLRPCRQRCGNTYSRQPPIQRRKAEIQRIFKALLYYIIVPLSSPVWVIMAGQRMRQYTALALVALCGGIVLMQSAARSDSAKEGLRAAKQNIIQNVRDDVQRRRAHPTSELQLDRDRRRISGSKNNRSYSRKRTPY